MKVWRVILNWTFLSSLKRVCLIRDVLRLGWKPAVSAAPLQKSSPPSLLLWIGWDRIGSKIWIDFSTYPQNLNFFLNNFDFIHFVRIPYNIKFKYNKKTWKNIFSYRGSLYLCSNQNTAEMTYFVHFIL